MPIISVPTFADLLKLDASIGEAVGVEDTGTVYKLVRLPASSAQNWQQASL